LDSEWELNIAAIFELPLSLLRVFALDCITNSRPWLGHSLSAKQLISEEWHLVVRIRRRKSSASSSSFGLVGLRR
jgi:hypothetical protein